MFKKIYEKWRSSSFNFKINDHFKLLNDHFGEMIAKASHFY